ncbi:MAG: serine hydrolase domain-containing protein [Propionibacteriaceae bacterium]
MNEQLSGAAARAAAAYVDSWLGFRRRHLRLPGLQASVTDAAGTVVEVAHGYADVEAGTVMTPRHLFRIASHSKTFTATVIMQLVEDGALRLDDAVATHLGWLAGSEIAVLTLRELLSHSGGVIRDGRAANWWQLSGPFPDAAGLRALALDDPALIPASERFKYSNVAYSLLGAVITAATGHPYNDVVQTRVIGRLGLGDTAPEWLPERAADYACGYSALGYAEHRIPIDHVDTRAMSAATGFTSTATDVCRYVSAHVDGDHRLLTDRSKRLMRHPAWPIAGGDTSYGLGLELSEVAGVALVGHGGGYPGHSTKTVVDPAGGVAVSVLTNAIDGPASALATGVVKIIHAAGAEPEAGEAVGPEADRFCGRFASLWGVIDVVRLGRRLLVISPTAEDPLADLTVVAPGGPDRLKVVHDGGYGGYAEQLAYTFGPDDAVLSVSGPAGITQVPIGVMTALVTDHDRVSLGTIPS